jgi:hypothetical protein
MLAVSTEKRYSAEQIANRTAPRESVTLEAAAYPPYALYKRDSLTQLVFPNLSYAPERLAAENANLTRVIAQKAANLGLCAFAYNPKLQCVDILGAAGGYMGSLNFASNPRLEVLIIRTTGGVYLPNVNSFQGSASSGKPLQVYVPAALRPSYEDSGTNGNWAALLSAGSVVFRELENSAYENLNWWRN